MFEEDCQDAEGFSNAWFEKRTERMSEQGNHVIDSA